eukprot:TRINITY_DN89391_c0_g1_i1.p2 TRINITY_DN89391_c0_g1~~TRINITY_DN89391_c0_g1_i1.p2  ORF type:complete len:188 (+),score=36.09 TRINITY_DN89391_c0_g1_i1:141-704(+)
MGTEVDGLFQRSWWQNRSVTIKNTFIHVEDDAVGRPRRSTSLPPLPCAKSQPLKAEAASPAWNTEKNGGHGPIGNDEGISKNARGPPEYDGRTTKQVGNGLTYDHGTKKHAGVCLTGDVTSASYDHLMDDEITTKADDDEDSVDASSDAGEQSQVGSSLRGETPDSSEWDLPTVCLPPLEGGWMQEW